ncbi:MAG: sulfatase [Gemmatimonadaceae bacterium]
MLLIAAWLGLVTGVGEVALRLLAVAALDKIVHFDPNLVWMAPVADTVILTVLSLPLLAASRWSSRIGSPIAIFLGLFFAFLTALYSYPRVHEIAMILLAAGLAAQASRIAIRRPDLVRQVIRRSAIPLAAVIVLLGLGAAGWRSWKERQAIAGLPAAPANAPNILLLIWDTARAASLSAYGYERATTPNLEQLAKQGVIFDRAIATAPWTLPSHATMFTGRYPFEMSADWESPLDRTDPTLAEVLRDQGYATGGFVANGTYGTYEFGLDRGFTHYEAYAVSAGQVLQSSALGRRLTALYNKALGTYHWPGRKNAATISGDFLRWQSRNRERPFFAFLNYLDPHEPYVAEVPSGLQFTDQVPSTRTIQTGRRHTPEEIRSITDAYDNAIAYTDYHLGLLLDALGQRGVLRNTVVIVTSDHGEELGEHGAMSHGSSLYLPSLHVPLVIAYPPRVPAGARVGNAVSLRDLPATIIDVADVPIATRLPGNSLTRYWSEASTTARAESPLLSQITEPANQPAWYPVSKGDMASLIESPYHYIRNGDGREELYDIYADPWQRHDLAAIPNGRALVERLRVSLDSLVPSARDRGVRGRK